MIQQINRFIKGKACFAGFALLFIANVDAQIPDERDLSAEDIKRVKTELNLVADKINIKSQTLMIDSALLKLRIEAEEENLMPADDLYDGEWNNEYVKAYGNTPIPDRYTIDVSQFVMPFEGHVTSKFGVRRRRFHYGTDIKLQIGDTVRAAFDGKVRIKKNQGRRKGYGKYLVLRHPNGLETVYGHLSDYLVDQDETVKAGQPIGLGGNTGRSFGSHLHFECRFLGMPINPEEIVDFDNQCTFDEKYTFVKSKSEKYNYAAARKTQLTSAAKTAAAKRKTTTTSQAKKSTVKQSAATSTGSKIKYHRIQKGDTLGGIAAKYGVSVATLCKLNGMRTSSTLKIGKIIRCS
jgi:murein DD-endopeptidase MepM/ murein hydrolase activator NlpD